MAYPVTTTALVLLGYSMVLIKSNPGTFPANLAEDPDVLADVTARVTQIEALDLEISAAVSDSMALNVADIKLDYDRYMRQALAKGSRLINELSVLISVPILKNKYLEKNSTLIAVRSYG